MKCPGCSPGVCVCGKSPAESIPRGDLVVALKDTAGVAERAMERLILADALAEASRTVLESKAGTEQRWYAVEALRDATVAYLKAKPA